MAFLHVLCTAFSRHSLGCSKCSITYMLPQSVGIIVLSIWVKYRNLTSLYIPLLSPIYIVWKYTTTAGWGRISGSSCFSINTASGESLLLSGEMKVMASYSTFTDPTLAGGGWAPHCGLFSGRLGSPCSLCRHRQGWSQFFLWCLFVVELLLPKSFLPHQERVPISWSCE